MAAQDGLRNCGLSMKDREMALISLLNSIETPAFWGDLTTGI
jgi:hypothetical protein